MVLSDVCILTDAYNLQRLIPSIQPFVSGAAKAYAWQ